MSMVVPSSGQVLVYAVDGGSEQYDFTDELADVGEIQFEFEENTGECSSGDASFSVRNDGQALYDLLQTGRQFRVEITCRPVKFVGDLQVENSGWDPDKLEYIFYALQMTKGFIDQAAATPIAPVYTDSLPSPQAIPNSDPHPSQPTDTVANIISSSLAAMSSWVPFQGCPVSFQQAFGAVLYQPPVDTSDSSIAANTIAHHAYWYRPDGSEMDGNLGLFAQDYGYMLKDFLDDCCTQWGGAYWIDSEGVLQIRQRGTPWTTISGYDGHIKSFKTKLRSPWYDMVAIHRSVYVDFVVGTWWLLYTKNDDFIYPQSQTLGGNDPWDSFSDMGGLHNYEHQYLPSAVFFKCTAYIPDGNNYTITSWTGITGVIAPVGSGLDVNLPSKYSSVGKPLGSPGNPRIKPIFFSPINTAADIRARFKPMVTPMEEATVTFDELIEVEPFWGVTCYGNTYIVYRISYDLPNRETIVVAYREIS
jgi:hypothetical protein